LEQNESILLKDMQIKINRKDIEWYKEIASIFGKVIHIIANMIAENNEIKVGQIIFEFESIIKQAIHEYSFPFMKQKNSIGESFTRSLCVSINNCVAHGKPNFKTKIIKGDIVKIDGGISAIAPSKRIMYFDSAITVACGSSKTKEKLDPIVIAPAFSIKEMLKLEGTINTKQLSKIIENTAEIFGFDIVTELCGHGIGYQLHNDPFITNMTTPEAAVDLIPGTFICPEPMYVKNGKGSQAPCYIDSDGWSVITNNISSHWETILYYDGNNLIDVVGIISI